jgi:2-hydroxy-3-keto-5-methylthiopentenyl-1-phosphate phosphatase
MRLALDWDGTVTVTDTLHMLLVEFGDPELYTRTEASLGRGVTLHEVIGAQMATIPVPIEEAVQWLVENVEVRAGFHELVRDEQPVLVSAGFHELIEPILASEGVVADLRANRLSVDAGRWRCHFRSSDPCAVCGEPCKRADVADLGPYAYAGDGISDRCVSLAAERRFARAGLARYLEAEGVRFEHFDDLADVRRGLREPLGEGARL